VLFGANVAAIISIQEENMLSSYAGSEVIDHLLGAGLSLLVPGRKWHHSLPLAFGNLCRNEYGSKLLLSWTRWPSITRKVFVGS